jgi:hypothetical protein
MGMIRHFRKKRTPCWFFVDSDVHPRQEIRVNDEKVCILDGVDHLLAGFDQGFHEWGDFGDGEQRLGRANVEYDHENLCG